MVNHNAYTPTVEDTERSIRVIWKLSDREMEVVKLTADGLTAKEVADRLFIATRTVEGHLLNARRKLGAKTTPHLVRLALTAKE